MRREIRAERRVPETMTARERARSWDRLAFSSVDSRKPTLVTRYYYHVV